jgi:hypothetical protein
MYIGIDLVVRYRTKTKRVGISLKNAKDINKFRQEIEKIDPSDFVEAQIIHEPTKIDKTITSKDALIERLYHYMTYIPPEAAEILRNQHQ